MTMETLYSDMKILSSILAKRISVPVLKAVWSQGAYLVVSDLDMTLMAEQKDGFKLLSPVDCKMFTEAVKCAGPDGKITQGSDGVTVIGQGKEQFIPYLNKEEAEIPAQKFFYERQTKMELGVDDLEYVYNARTTESVRYALQGVCLDGDQKALIASDGKRLHWRTLKREKGFAKIIMPQAACATAIKIMKAEPGTEISMLGLSKTDVTLAKTGKKVDETQGGDASFRVGRFILFTRLMEGHFPDWEQVRPDTFLYTICVEAKPFKQALNEAQSFLLKAEQKSYYVVLWLDGQNLKVMTKPLATATASKEAEKVMKKVMERTWTIPVTRKSGYPDGVVDSVFNPEYLIDGQWNLETTTLQGSGKEKPMCIDGSAIVMPLTISVGRDNSDASDILTKMKEMSASQPRVAQTERPKRQPKKTAVAIKSKAAAQVEKEPVAKPVMVRSSSRRVAVPAKPKRLKDYRFKLFPFTV